MIDQEKLRQFMGKMVVDLGSAMSVPLVRIGLRLGLYRAMHGAGPMTSTELAEKTKISTWSRPVGLPNSVPIT